MGDGPASALLCSRLAPGERALGAPPAEETRHGDSEGEQNPV